MLIKIIIFIFFAVIIYSLASGLFYLVRDRGKTTHTVRALTWRIGLSLALFVFILIAYWLGFIVPGRGV